VEKARAQVASLLGCATVIEIPAKPVDAELQPPAYDRVERMYTRVSDQAVVVAEDRQLLGLNATPRRTSCSQNEHGRAFASTHRSTSTIGPSPTRPRRGDEGGATHRGFESHFLRLHRRSVMPIGRSARASARQAG
jgi:hypothetical protein